MAEVVRTLLQIAKAAKRLPGNFWLRLVGEATGGAKVQVTGHRSSHLSHTKTIGHWTKLFCTDVLLYKISQGTLMIFLSFKQYYIPHM